MTLAVGGTLNTNTTTSLILCICQKAQIGSVSTQVELSLCFFATLIGNLPALIENSQKIFNPKLKDYCLFLYLHGGWRIWSLNSREMFSRDAANMFELYLNILTPVPDVSTVNLNNFTCNLLEMRQL